MADAMCGGCGETDPMKACLGCLHFASPPAREEAPAEGAGEIEEGAKLLWHRFASSAVDQWSDETHQAEYRLAATDLFALRNRTSEPEAGAVETLGPSAGFWSNVITHPAPATADKLPDDVRRLVLAARAVGFGPDCGRNAVIDALDKASEAFADRVPWDDEPLAALNEQPQ